MTRHEPRPDVERKFLARITRQGFVALLRRSVQHPWGSLRILLDRWYESRHPEEPYLAPAAVRFLEHVVRLPSAIFEWGSGTSTIWLAARCELLVSVEHTKLWFNHVGARLPRGVDYRYVPLDHPESKPTRPIYETVPKYVGQIRDFPDETFDLCLVDGHYRQACVLASLPKLKVGGYLLIDDAQWLTPTLWGIPANWPVALEARSWAKTTGIWRKPSHL